MLPNLAFETVSWRVADNLALEFSLDANGDESSSPRSNGYKKSRAHRMGVLGYRFYSISRLDLATTTRGNHSEQPEAKESCCCRLRDIGEIRRSGRVGDRRYPKGGPDNQ